MPDVQVFQIDGLLVWECVKESLEELPVFVSVYPMLIRTRLYFFELKTRVRMERKPMPIFSVYPQVSDEQTFCSTRQVEYTYNSIDLGYDGRTDRT